MVFMKADTSILQYCVCRSEFRGHNMNIADKQVAASNRNAARVRCADGKISVDEALPGTDHFVIVVG